MRQTAKMRWFGVVSPSWFGYIKKLRRNRREREKEGKTESLNTKIKSGGGGVQGKKKIIKNREGRRKWRGLNTLKKEEVKTGEKENVKEREKREPREQEEVWAKNRRKQ